MTITYVRGVPLLLQTVLETSTLSSAVRIRICTTSTMLALEGCDQPQFAATGRIIPLMDNDVTAFRPLS